MNYLSAFYPELRALSIDDFDIATKENSDNDHWFGWKENYNFVFTPKMFLQKDFSIKYKANWKENTDWKETTVREISDSRFPRLVMFRDSCADNIIPFLSEHFSRSIYLPLSDLLTNISDHQIFRNERPDIVILQLVERRLHTLEAKGTSVVSAFKLRELGVEYYKKGDYKKAKEVFEKLIRSGEDDAVLMNNIGSVYNALKERNKAIVILNKAISKSPAYLEAYCNLGIAYNNAGRHSDALATYKNALNIYSASESAHFGLGETYYYMKDYPHAIDEFKKVVMINPKSIDSYYNLASIYSEKKDFSSGLDWLEKAAIAGFRDFESVRKDAVFAPIINDKRFQRIEKGLPNKAP